MPTLPTTPTPLRVSAPQIIDPILTQQFDQGHEHRRSRYSRGRRRYNLEYLISSAELHILLDFFERITRVGALSFDWDYPYQHTIDQITAGVPNVVSTTERHGFQSNDQVRVTDTSFHDGIYTITRTAPNDFRLLGTSGGIAENNIGNVALHFANMVVVAPEALPMPQFREGYGALRNDDGLFDFSITLEEKFG